MVRYERDIRLIRILRWRSMMQNFFILGAIFLAAGIYRLSEDSWAFTRLTAIYLPVGLALLAGGLWLLTRGPSVNIDNNDVTENDI